MATPIYTGGAPSRSDIMLEELPAPLGQALGATAEDVWLRSPLSSLFKSSELDIARYGTSGTGAEGFEDRPATPYIPAAQAREKVKNAGVKLDLPDEPVPEGYVDLLIERKSAEMARKDAIARAPGGFWAGAAKIGTGIGVSLLDPINVASAFIPIVGEARFAGLTASMGLTGARAVRGAAEGAVGAAMVEPIVLGAAAAEQADYGLADSFSNVAFGTVIGGGLHVGAGAVGDWVAKGRPAQTAPAAAGAIPQHLDTLTHDQRASILRVAISQAFDGRSVDIDPMLGRDFRPEPPRTVSATVGGAMDAAEAPIRLRVDERTAQIDAIVRREHPDVADNMSRISAERDAITARLEQLGVRAGDTTPEIATAATRLRELDAKLADIEKQLLADSIDPKKAKRLERQRSETTAERDAARTQLEDTRGAAGDVPARVEELDKQIADLDRKISEPGTGSRKAQDLGSKRDALIAERDAAIRSVSGVDEAGRAQFEAGRAQTGADTAALRQDLKRLDAELAREERLFKRARREIEHRTGSFYDVEQLKAVAERQMRPEARRLVDMNLADEVTAKVAAAPKGADPVALAKAEADELEADVRDLEMRLGLPEEKAAADAFDIVAETEVIVRATKAMAACGMRR